MSGEIRRLFNKNDVLKVTVIKLLKSKQDHKGSVYQSDIESCYLKRYYYYLYIYSIQWSREVQVGRERHYPYLYCICGVIRIYTDIKG